MAERFTTRVTAVNNLHAGALAADTTNFDIWPLCCDTTRLTEVFNNNYGCVVDMAVACIRGPCTHGVLDTNRTAAMPSVLGGTPVCGNLCSARPSTTLATRTPRTMMVPHDNTLEPRPVFSTCSPVAESVIIATT